ncbi:MAG: YceI family protein [Chitinophagaceae bacterium]|nr:YceI family protein [Chitinophagaceae bacterium]
MKKIVFVLLVAFIGSAGIMAFSPKAEKRDLVSYAVLADYSKVEWVGSKTSGYHTGAFTVKSGEVKFDGTKLAGGKFTIDLNSLKLVGEDAPKFVDHLKSKDFFETSTFAEATYEISEVEYTTDTDVKIKGSLNLKGISVPVSFPAVIRNADDKRFFAQAFFSIDRTLWGINYGLPNVAKDVQVSVYLFANK